MMTLSRPSTPPAPAEGQAAPCPEEVANVRAAARGDVRAFERLVHLHHTRVFNFLQHMTRHRQDAEDLTQQTFIKAFHHMDSFDCTRPLINWLLTIARRSALNHFRAARKWDHAPEEIASGEASPARVVEQEDHARNVWDRARRLLSQREFEVMWLRFAEDLSTEETARIAGLTQTHVKVLIFRARQRLLKGEMPL